jgi:hypothetical protein
MVREFGPARVWFEILRNRPKIAGLLRFLAVCVAGLHRSSG